GADGRRGSWPQFPVVALVQGRLRPPPVGRPCPARGHRLLAQPCLAELQAAEAHERVRVPVALDHDEADAGFPRGDEPNTYVSAELDNEHLACTHGDWNISDDNGSTLGQIGASLPLPR